MSKKTDGWMPLYVADYLADTARLTTEQHGAYMLLIMDYWRNGAPPDDDAVLAQICRLQPAQWRKHAPLLRGFFESSGGKLVHKRIDFEREKASGISDKRTTAAKQGAAKRWHKEMPNSIANGIANGIANAEQTTSQNDAPSPYTINQVEPSGSTLLVDKRRKRLPPDFSPSDSGIDFAQKRGVNVADELQKFTDYHSAKGTVMADWQAAWRTWVGNAKTFARPSVSPVTGTGGLNRQEALEARNRAVAQAWIAQQAQAQGAQHEPV